MQTEHGPELHRQLCGCTTLSKPGKDVVYTPCLACALKNAGIMMIEAGKRLTEAAERDRQEMEEKAEEARAQAEDFIGGSD